MEGYIIMLISFAIIGSIGNFVSLIFYIRQRTSVPYIFIRTLSAVDFLTCSLTIPLTVWLEFNNHWIRSEILCKCSWFMLTSVVPFSAMMMVAIATDRLFAIVLPFSGELTQKKSYVIIGIIAFVSCMFGMAISAHHTISLHIGGRDYICYNCSSIENETSHLQNDSNIETVFTTEGFCVLNKGYVSASFFELLRYVYASIFACSVVMTIILYSIIYIKVVMWRKKRSKLFEKSHVRQKFPVPDLTTGPSKRLDTDRPSFRIRHSLHYNIKLAILLFSVSLVFICAYLPAWLMSFKVIDYNQIVFYLHFSYNVIHPVSYALMDDKFRKSISCTLCVCHHGQS